MSHRQFASMVVSCVVLAFGLAHAAEDSSDGEGWCRNGLFSEEGHDFAFYRVTADSSHLLMDRYSGDTRCPNAAVADCRWREVVRRGDVVLANKTAGRFICAFLHNDAGFLPLSDVERSTRQPTKHPRPSAWAGRWGTEDMNISISVRGNRLHAIGEAYWPGKDYSPPPDGGPSRHEGEFEIDAVPSGNSADFVDADDDCAVHAVLFATLLIVSDNSQCGGMNVRFEGVLSPYKRR